MAQDGANVRLWIRRAHLYAGLALLPWVLLYAASGMLFNHPDWSARPGGPQRFVLADLDTPGEDATVLDASAAAAAVLRTLGTTADVVDRPAPVLRRSLRAKSSGLEGSGSADELSVRFPSRRGSWGKRVNAQPRTPPSLAGVSTIEVPDHNAASWQSFADAIATEVRGRPTTLKLSHTPTVRFHAQIDGERWQVDYDANTGEVAFEALADREVHLPRLLARLHMTHVYPDTLGVSWLHALLVDLSALCLVLWCITGVFMWWQMRRLRRVGWLVLGSGLLFAVLILTEVIPALLS